MKNEFFKYELGQELKDDITGFQGIVMARVDYLTGCKHYGLQSPMDKDGKIQGWEYMDESRLQPTGKSIKAFKTEDDPLSGPCGNPPQM